MRIGIFPQRNYRVDSVQYIALPQRLYKHHGKSNFTQDVSVEMVEFSKALFSNFARPELALALGGV